MQLKLALLALLLAVPLAAQTPTTQSIKVFVTSYSIDAAAMAAFQGCQAGDTGCNTILYICDETKRCLGYGSGTHTFTFNFVHNGGTEAGVRTPVANATIQINAQ